MPFTNEDLKVMLDECIEELSALGYETLPILKIEFSKKALKRCYAYCKQNSKYYYSYYDRSHHNVGLVIRVSGEFNSLPNHEKKWLKTLVMHEVIHAIRRPSFKGNGKNQPNNGTITGHGERYDRIKREVERILGYKHIDDDEGCGLKKYRYKKR